jgi:hypothetical protein
MKSGLFTLFIWVIFIFNVSVGIGMFPILFVFYFDFIDENWKIILWIIFLIISIAWIILTVFLDRLLKKKREQLKEESKNDLSKMQD